MKKYIALATLLSAGTLLVNAGWNSGNKDYEYYVNDTSDIIATDKAESIEIMAGDLGSATVGKVEMATGQTMNISVNYWSGSKNKNLNLTITSLVAENANIVVGNDQTLTLNGLKGSVSSITVNGSLNLHSGIVGLNNFTLDADSEIGGIYNVGQSGLDQVTFTLTDTGVIEAQLATGENYTKKLTGTMWNAEKIKSAVLNAGEYENKGLVFLNETTGDYYNKTTWNNGVVSYDESDKIVLSEDSAYIIANVKGNNITGLYATITVPEPSAFGVFAGLSALVFVVSRRRRR